MFSQLRPILIEIYSSYKKCSGTAMFFVYSYKTPLSPRKTEHRSVSIA